MIITILLAASAPTASDWTECLYQTTPRYEVQQENAEVTVDAVFEHCAGFEGRYRVALDKYYLTTRRSSRKAQAAADEAKKSLRSGLIEFVMDFRSRNPFRQ